VPSEGITKPQTFSKTILSLKLRVPRIMLLPKPYLWKRQGENIFLEQENILRAYFFQKIVFGVLNISWHGTLKIEGPIKGCNLPCLCVKALRFVNYF